MSYFFTSDQHFGSERTLELSKRPFKSTDEMDQVIIDRFNSKVKKDSLFITLKIKYKFPKNSDLWIEILKLLGDIENIVDVTNAELDDYTIISIKDKTKIKQKDLFDLLKICKIDFHMQN